MHLCPQNTIDQMLEVFGEVSALSFDEEVECDECQENLRPAVSLLHVHQGFHQFADKFWPSDACNILLSQIVESD